MSDKIGRYRRSKEVDKYIERRLAGNRRARFISALLRILHLRPLVDARRSARDADVPTPKGFLIDLLVPPDRAEDMLLELQKGFERWVPKYGARCAQRMFMTHSVGSIIGFWINWMKKHLNVLRFFAS